MLSTVLATNTDLLVNLSTLLLRLALGLVILPHGLQKAFGWFGGYGYRGTMGYFTQTVHVPYFLGVLTILTETLGALALIAGFLTRPAALAIGVVMLMAALLDHRPNGFFMNWSGRQRGEGFEYHVLAGAMALGLVVAGGGAWSLDPTLLAAAGR